MDLNSEVIKILNLSKDEISEIYNKTSNLNLSDSLDSISGSIVSKILEKFESVKNNIHVIEFLKKYHKFINEDIKVRISIYSSLKQINYFDGKPSFVLRHILDICNANENYQEFVFLIVTQLTIPICFISVPPPPLPTWNATVSSLNECMHLLFSA